MAREMDRGALTILSNMVVGMETEAWCTLGENFTEEWQLELQPRSVFQVNQVISVLSLYTGVFTCRHTHAHTHKHAHLWCEIL